MLNEIGADYTERLIALAVVYRHLYYEPES